MTEAKPADDDLLTSVRDVLAGRRGVVEKRMIGGRCFMVDGHLCCGVSREGLMIRVGAGRSAHELSRPDVRPVEMGGRALPGYVRVDGAALGSVAAVAAWVELGVAFVETLPPRQAGR